MEKYEIRTRYRVFEIRDGLLKRPTDGHHGAIFDDYETRSEVGDALMLMDHFGNYVVLPLVCKVIKWDDD